MQISNIGFWESWRRSQSINRKRVWGQMGGALSGLLPWQHTLHAIEGKTCLSMRRSTMTCSATGWFPVYCITMTRRFHHNTISSSNPRCAVPGRFGVGVKAYFVFLRYLVYLNLLHCALVGGFILGPTAFYGRSKSSGESPVMTHEIICNSEKPPVWTLLSSLCYHRAFEVWRQRLGFGFLPGIGKSLFACVLYALCVCHLMYLLLSTGLPGSFSGLLRFLHPWFPEFAVLEYASAIPRWNVPHPHPQSHPGGPSVSWEITAKGHFKIRTKRFKITFKLCILEEAY